MVSNCTAAAIFRLSIFSLANDVNVMVIFFSSSNAITTAFGQAPEEIFGFAFGFMGFLSRGRCFCSLHCWNNVAQKHVDQISLIAHIQPSFSTKYRKVYERINHKHVEQTGSSDRVKKSPTTAAMAKTLIKNHNRVKRERNQSSKTDAACRNPRS